MNAKRMSRRSTNLKLAHMAAKLSHSAVKSTTDRYLPPIRDPGESGRRGAPTAWPRTEALVYSVPRRAYLYQQEDGRWSLNNPLTAKAAQMHLRALGLPAEHAKAILEQALLEIVHGEVCHPGRAAILETGDRMMMNAYVPPAIEPKPGKFPTICLILKNVTGGTTEGVDHVLNWLAFKAQAPTRRNMTAIVLQGGRGIGKTLLGTIFTEVIGPENTATLNPGDLRAEHNDHYTTKLLVMANEFSLAANPEGTEALMNTYITDPRVFAHGKYVRQHQIENCMSWVVTTNSGLPVNLPDDDRRYSVFQGRCPERSGYWAALAELFNPDGGWSPKARQEIAAFAYMLMRYDVDEQRVLKPFDNLARRSLIEASKKVRPVVAPASATTR